MISRNSEDRITFHCDTPGCKAELQTHRRFYNAAAKRARAQDWAIGTENDACPAHHV